ncbi:hypothetical protein LTR54_018316 [Friedmanniomyces endolithicus]|nr:hypothetical protein LTR54_018316 [Friedmanniomyces endolithicus]
MFMDHIAIGHWIEHSSLASTITTSCHTTFSRGRHAQHKRKRVDSETNTDDNPNRCKRSILRVMSGKAVRGRPWLTPRTPKRRITPAQEEVEEAKGEEEPYLEDETPRANRGPHHADTHTPRTNAPSWSSTTSTASKRSRTSSPTKLSTLMSLQSPIDMDTLDEGRIAVLAVDMQRLVRTVQECAEGFATVPEDYKEALQQTSEPAFRRLDLFYSAGSARAELGGAPTMAEVDRISSRARDCRASNEYEASWNSFVHGPLLDLAQYTSRHRMQVDVAKLTTAQLSTHLKPRFATSDRPAQGKLVDFAILLRRSPAIDQGYFDLPLEDGSNTNTLNHTVHAPCIMRPIAVSIETKREGEGGVEGRTQLSVWVAAHFTRLEELVRQRLDKHAPPPVLPPLPLVLVQGVTWSLLVAQRDSAGKTTVLAQLGFGDATTRLGVFKIVSTLHHLFEWANKVYRPWFEERCLGRAAGEADN